MPDSRAALQHYIDGAPPVAAHGGIRMLDTPYGFIRSTELTIVAGISVAGGVATFNADPDSAGIAALHAQYDLTDPTAVDRILADLGASRARGQALADTFTTQGALARPLAPAYLRGGIWCADPFDDGAHVAQAVLLAGLSCFAVFDRNTVEQARLAEQARR